MRSMAGAEEFCAIRSYLATAARHGISGLDALTRAFKGNPGSLKPDNPRPRQSCAVPADPILGHRRVAFGNVARRNTYHLAMPMSVCTILGC
jgi:hypothetical protein